MTKDEALRLALRAMESFQNGTNGLYEGEFEEEITAIKAALEAKDEPVAWGTRERFYEAIDRAVENARQEMLIKTVTMRCKDYDLALPVIDTRRGHILVGQVHTPPQRKPLTDEEIRKWWASENGLEDCDMCKIDDFILVARAIERAHGIKGEA